MGYPDLAIVVMDCVRAWDFPGGAEPVEGLSFVDDLRRESVTFTHAASVAPWTMPSHASIFTGLHPWEHGMHGRHSMALAPEVARLPDLLRPLGYRSACISANPLVSPTTGLSAGFDYCAWGTMFEMFLRTDHRTSPPRTLPEKTAGPATAPSLRSRLLSRLPYDEIPLRSLLERNVILPTVAGRVLEGLRDCQRNDSFDVARWIEPTLSEFLKTVPQDQPSFCFVNLLDAHEPYFADPSTRPDGQGWWAYARLRQDRLGWLQNPRRRQGRDVRFLRALYREAIRRIDRRIRSIVEVFREHGRWEEICFVLTSDHGQAFGEHGMIYHRFRVDDAQIRIPMIVRFPHGEHGGGDSASWASLVDLAPTLFRAVGQPAPTRFSGAPLQDLVHSTRFDPVFAITDGTIGERWIPESRRPELDRLAAAAYRGPYKVIVESSPESVHAFNVDEDRGETRDVWSSAGSDVAELAAEARTIVGRLEALPHEPISPEVSERLEAWGYI